LAYFSIFGFLEIWQILPSKLAGQECQKTWHKNQLH